MSFILTVNMFDGHSSNAKCDARREEALRRSYRFDCGPICAEKKNRLLIHRREKSTGSAHSTQRLLCFTRAFDVGGHMKTDTCANHLFLLHATWRPIFSEWLLMQFGRVVYVLKCFWLFSLVVVNL